MKMKFLIVQVFTFALFGSGYGAAVENCHQSRLAACGDPLAEFRKEMGQSFPTTEEQVSEFCNNMKKALDCTEEFQNKCMTPLQLETLGFLAEGPLVVYEDFCKEDSEIRTDYLKHAQCLDDTSKTDEVKGYYSYVEAALEDLSEKPAEKRLATACCGYQWLHSRNEKIGRERCGEEAVESYARVVEMAVSSLPTVFCSGFDPDEDQCKVVLPPAGAKPKGTIRESHIAKTFASMYVPDVQV